MKRATLLLASALMISPAMFAQSATPQDQSSATQSSTTSSQAATTQDSNKSAKANLTADQRAELKTLHTKVRTECKADKTSDACKQAKADLKAKKSEYGMTTGKHHRAHKNAAAAQTQSPTQ